jgi:hypothetical protein
MAGYFVRLIMAGLLTTLADAFPPGRVWLLLIVVWRLEV